MISQVFVAATIASSLAIGGCAAVAGAGAAGGAYEYQAKQQLDKLEEEFKGGKISKEEYLKRKKEIEERSVVY